MIALVFDVIDFLIESGSSPYVMDSISAKIGFEPTKRIEFAVEMKEKDDVMPIK